VEARTSKTKVATDLYLVRALFVHPKYLFTESSYGRMEDEQRESGEDFSTIFTKALIALMKLEPLELNHFQKVCYS
jgi:hypothetical protein